jgi:hypothetical protein
VSETLREFLQKVKKWFFLYKMPSLIFLSSSLTLIKFYLYKARLVQEKRPSELFAILRRFTLLTPAPLFPNRIPQLVAYADQPWRNGRRVAITQTRRIAAISAARRVADEMDCKSLLSRLLEKGYLA